VTLSKLPEAANRLDQVERRAKRVYTLLLKKYSQSPVLLRQYASFLADVQNDPGKADAFFQRAKKLEEMKATEMATSGVYAM
jgi:hypothetical protein